MSTSVPKLLVYSADVQLLDDFCNIGSLLEFKCSKLSKIKELPKLESLDYFQLILFNISEDSSEAEIEALHKIKDFYPGLALPLILFGKMEKHPSILELGKETVQDFISYPITREFLDFRLGLQLNLKRSFDEIKDRQNKLEAEIAEKTKAYKLAQFKAEESERLKTSFLNNLSHELRTPMNGILGFIDYLEDPDLEGEMRSQFIQNIKTSSARLLNTLHDLIEISEIEAGAIKTEFGPCNLAQINKVLFDRYHSRCQLKGLQLIQEFQIGPKQSIILSDINKIKSIFFHLLNNAIKFSDTGSIRYGFRQEGNQLVGYVTDEGPGIEKKDLNLLMQHFTQVEDHLTRQHDGLGIGLTISKAFAESLNGKIVIESTPGKGSTFSLSIPYRQYEEIETPEPIAEGQTLADKEALEVIIVDDDLINLQLMRKMLEKRAIKIHEAQNGVEAVKLYEKFPHSDLILMDLKMPLMDGYEAVEEIRSKGGVIPIIAQTAYAMPIDKERAIDSGCNDYISKPLNKDLLLAKIDKLAQ